MVAVIFYANQLTRRIQETACSSALVVPYIRLCIDTNVYTLQLTLLFLNAVDLTEKLNSDDWKLIK